jgi:hypothetical protein
MSQISQKKESCWKAKTLNKFTKPIAHTHGHKHTRIKSRYNGETEEKGRPTQSNYL